VAMVATVLAIAAIAYFLLGLPLGASILLGGILAPTDPVLASDVQVTHPKDRDSLRFALTGEGGLNDGTAFPFVLLGLGLLGLHELGELGWRWLLIDGLWACLGGLALGALSGLAVGKLVLYLRREHKEAVGLDDFLALGLLAFSYGAALLVQVNGFLAVFAAGVALRHLEQSQSAGIASQRAVEHAAVHPDASVADMVAVDPHHAPAYMAQAVLSFNVQMERIGELAVVIAIGALFWSVDWRQASWWFVPALLLLVRPLVVGLTLIHSPVSHTQRWLIGWFGIRGVGSVYYLMYAINHGLPVDLANRIAGLTLAVVVVSIIVHGISVTPLMAAYERASSRRSVRNPRSR
jgi:sodium/hydrogen antiporter